MDKITNSEYVLRSALLSDISEERSKLSETNQIPDIYCCNVSRTVQQTCDNFQHMSDTLEDPLLGVDAFDKCLCPTENYKLLPKFYETAQELKESGTQQGLPILQTQHYPVGQSTRKRAGNAVPKDVNDQIRDVRNQGAAYIKDVTRTLKDRFADEKNAVMKNVADLFDLERVLDRE